MDQLPLFAIAPDAISVSARYEIPGGWAVTVAARASGEPFRATDFARYDHLTAAELVDVILQELWVRLKLT